MYKKTTTQITEEGRGNVKENILGVDSIVKCVIIVMEPG